MAKFARMTRLAMRRGAPRLATVAGPEVRHQ